MSLGYSWQQACAAAYAGISRPSELGFLVRNPDTKDQEPAVGQAVRPTGIEGVDEGGACPNPLVDPNAMPPSKAEWMEDCQRLTGLSLGDHNFVHINSGNTGVIEAWRVAYSCFAEGRWTQCLVIATDSLLEASTLQWLFEQGRLETEGNAVGLQPGEAGVCFLLERESFARDNARSPLATIDSLVLVAEREGTRAQGVGLAEAITQLSDSVSHPESLAWSISDMNGELAPAMERAGEGASARAQRRWTIYGRS